MDQTLNAQKKQHAAFWSMVTSAMLTLAKFAAGLLSGSLSLLSEAVHGLIDTSATLMTYFAVRWANQPADEKHPFGHGKAEAIAALIESALLFALSAFVMVEAINRFFEPSEVEASWWAIAILVISIAVDLNRSKSLNIIAKETKSVALSADSLHFFSDFISSVCVLIALIFVRVGYPRADAIAAIIVAIFIAYASFRLALTTIETLIDTAPTGLADEIRAIVTKIPGVLEVRHVRVRSIGSAIAGDIIFDADRSLAFGRVAGIKEQIHAVLKEKFPEADLIIIANPVAMDNESIFARVLTIAAQRRLSVHHVTVQTNANKCSISLDLELADTMIYSKAHRLASALEVAIEADLGGDIEVETHVEPMHAKELSSQNAPPETAQSILSCLQKYADQGQGISDIHDLRVRKNLDGLIVNYHCRVDGKRSVADIHRMVDALEQNIRREHSEILRIVGHAEPI